MDHLPTVNYRKEAIQLLDAMPLCGSDNDDEEPFESAVGQPASLKRETLASKDCRLRL
jgi:hypothetical protein